MEDDPDSYVQTITEVIKEPREDKKIINSVIKEILINWELCVQNNDKFGYKRSFHKLRITCSK